MLQFHPISSETQQHVQANVAVHWYWRAVDIVQAGSHWMCRVNDWAEVRGLKENDGYWTEHWHWLRNERLQRELVGTSKNTNGEGTSHS